MPDFNFELHKINNDAVNRNEHNENDELSNSTGDKLRREYELLRDGISGGVMHRLSSPQDLLLGAGTAFAGGAALRMMLDAGGRWGQAAKVVGTGFALLAATDVVRRAIPTGAAMVDTWNSGANLDFNKNIVANNLGTALVDYPLMAVAGNAGFRVAGKPTSFTLDLAKPEFKNILDKGLPVNPSTRAAMTRPEIMNTHPGQRASMIKGEIKAPGEIKVPPKFDYKVPEIKLPAEFYNGKFNTNIKFDAIQVRTSLKPVFPVLPVDLMDDRQLLKRVNLAPKGGLIKEAVQELPKQNNDQIHKAVIRMEHVDDLIKKLEKK